MKLELLATPRVVKSNEDKDVSAKNENMKSEEGLNAVAIKNKNAA